MHQHLKRSAGHQPTRGIASHSLSLGSSSYDKESLFDDSLHKLGLAGADELSPFTVRIGMGHQALNPMAELRRNLVQLQEKRQEVSFCKSPSPSSEHNAQVRKQEPSKPDPLASSVKAEAHAWNSIFEVHRSLRATVQENFTARDDLRSLSSRIARLPPMGGFQCSARGREGEDSLEASGIHRLHDQGMSSRLSTSISGRLSPTGDSAHHGQAISTGSRELGQRISSFRGLPPRALVDGRCVTPFYHCCSESQASQIMKRIEMQCLKVDEACNENRDQSKGADSIDFSYLGQQIMRSLRPMWQMTKKKYQTNGALTFVYKMHIRQFWKFVVGRVLTTIHIQKLTVLKAARKVLGDLKRARDQEIAKISAQKKAKLAEQLFTELISLRSNKKNAVQLTQTLYLSLRNRFMELATEGTETINLREFVGPARLDANLVRKLDRDQSGTLEFSEVLKATFPSMLQKNLNALSRKWDFELRDETQQESAISVLSAESKAMAMAMFRLCDAQGKGVVSKDDMARHFVPADWDPSEPLWFERYFPNASAVVSFEEFVEMIKFCFPPFRHGTGYAQVLSRAESVKGESVKPWRLPADVIEAQDRAKACE